MINPNINKRVRALVLEGEKAEIEGNVYRIHYRRGDEVKPVGKTCYLYARYSIMLDEYYLSASNR